MGGNREKIKREAYGALKINPKCRRGKWGIMGVIAVLFGVFMSSEPDPVPAQTADLYIVYGHTGVARKISPDEIAFRVPSTQTIHTTSITWNITYEDVVAANGIGFNDPVNGAKARSIITAVVNYLGTVLNHTGTVDLDMLVSFVDGNHLLGGAGSVYATTPAGFQIGWIQKHLTTGVNPGPGFDGQMIFDFGQTWNFDYPNPTSAGEYDFFSVALHEFTHALGFLSLTASDGSSLIGTNVRSYIDRDMETGNGKDLFLNTGAGQFLGTASDLAGNDNGLVLNQTQAKAVYGSSPPLYAPNPFTSGSSLSHYDLAVPNAVMHPSLFKGVDKRAYTSVELATLAGLGYTVITPPPTPTPTRTATRTSTRTATRTPSPTRTATPSPTRTGTPSPTMSPTPTPTATITPTPFDDAQFIRHTVPAQLYTDQNYTVGIYMLNTGNTTWDPQVLYSLKKTTDPCNLVGPAESGIVSGATVVPWDFYVFSAVLQAPSTPQSCALEFQMTNAGSSFGATVSIGVQIVTHTPTPNLARDWTIYE